MDIRTSTLAHEGPLQVSKWVKIPVLLDDSEMETMLSEVEKKVGPFSFYFVQGVCSEEQMALISTAQFCTCYATYISYLKEEKIPCVEELKGMLSPILTQDPEAVYKMVVGTHRFLVKASRPVIQFQPNNIRYSPEEGVFRTQVYSKDTFTWGVMISYPFLFQDNKTHELTSTHSFPNTPIFHEIQRWIRHFTRPTPFVVGGKKIHAPIRLGKNCFSWIHRHPQLKAQGITIG